MLFNISKVLTRIFNQTSCQIIATLLLALLVLPLRTAIRLLLLISKLIISLSDILLLRQPLGLFLWWFDISHFLTLAIVVIDLIVEFLQLFILALACLAHLGRLLLQFLTFLLLDKWPSLRSLVLRSAPRSVSGLRKFNRRPDVRSLGPFLQLSLSFSVGSLQDIFGRLRSRERGLVLTHRILQLSLVRVRQQGVEIRVYQVVQRFLRRFGRWRLVVDWVVRRLAGCHLEVFLLVDTVTVWLRNKQGLRIRFLNWCTTLWIFDAWWD